MVSTLSVKVLVWLQAFEPWRGWSGDAPFRFRTLIGLLLKRRIEYDWCIFEIDYYNMKNFRTLTIWVALLYFVIVVGVGHGVIFIGLLEVSMVLHFFDISSSNFTFSLTASYDTSIGASMLFAFIGHVLLITSILIKRGDKKFWLKIAGIFFLLLSFYYLTHNLFTDSAAKLSFFLWTTFSFLFTSFTI